MQQVEDLLKKARLPKDVYWILFGAACFAHVVMNLLDSGAMWYVFLSTYSLVPRGVSDNFFVVPGLLMCLPAILALVFSNTRFTLASVILAGVNVLFALLITFGLIPWLANLASVTYLLASIALLVYTLVNDERKNALGVLCLLLGVGSILLTVILSMTTMRSFTRPEISFVGFRNLQRYGLIDTFFGWKQYLYNWRGSCAVFYPISRAVLVIAMGAGMLLAPQRLLIYDPASPLSLSLTVNHKSQFPLLDAYKANWRRQNH